MKNASATRIGIRIAAFLVIFLAVWLSALPTRGGPGLTWDEAYYYPTFRDVGQWSRTLLSAPFDALSSSGIEVGWSRINELPPVVKWLGAASVAFIAPEGWAPLSAMRVIPALAFAASILLLFEIGRRWRGTLCGVIAASVYTLHPRIFAHAQVAATETVFVFVTLLTLWIATHDLQKWKWRVALALMLGVALATKVNGIILLSAIVCWLATRRFAVGRFTRRGWFHDLLLATGCSLAVPIVAFAIWPWMWHDTFGRIGAYIQFIREHSHQGLWYMGRKWNFTGELAPITYPFTIAHLTAPIALLLVFWSGALVAFLTAIRRKKIHQIEWLVILLILAPLSASSLPTSPKYDGIRLFLPMFAPCALLAGGGWVLLLRPVKNSVLRRPHAALIAIPVLLVLAQSFLLKPTLSHYNFAARTIGRGEIVFPFEQTYWGDALRAEVIEDLNGLLPPNGRVKTLALQTETFAILQDWGVLRRDIMINGEPPYDVHLIQNRRGFWVNAEWAIFNNRDPLATWGRGSDGEALVFLYDGRPPRW